MTIPVQVDDPGKSHTFFGDPVVIFFIIYYISDMSDFKGHFKGGLVAAGIFFILTIIIQILFQPLAWVEIPLLIGICLFGAFWPDADIGSKSQRVVYIVFIVIDVILIFGLKYHEEAAILGLFAMLPAIGKHRGWTHKPLWALVVGLPFLLPPAVIGYSLLIDIGAHEARNLIFVGIPYYIAFLTGVASHLALDNLAYFKRKRSKAKNLPRKKNTKFDIFIKKALSLKDRFIPGKEPEPAGKGKTKSGSGSQTLTGGSTKNQKGGRRSKTQAVKRNSKTNTGKRKRI